MDPFTTKHLVSSFPRKRRDEMFRDEFYGPASGTPVECVPSELRSIPRQVLLQLSCITIYIHAAYMLQTEMHITNYNFS